MAKKSIFLLLGMIFTLKAEMNGLTTNYLQMLDIQTSLQPTLAILNMLQTNHIHTFSHDTIDCYFKRPLSLDPVRIIEKFLTEHPGGLCFELNGAFCYLLRQLGFDAILVSSHVCRVAKRVFHYTIDTHAVIIVTIEGKRYLVDVGFADSCRTPIQLEDGKLTDVSGSYKVVALDSILYGLYKYCDNQWLLQYTFDTKSRELHEFSNNLYFVTHSPEHEFSKNLICTKSTPTGHIVLLCLMNGATIKRKLLIKEGQDNRKIKIGTCEDVLHVLTTHFGITNINAIIKSVN